MKHVQIKGSTKLVDFVEPMSATLSERPPFDDPEWIFEVKWDGYRAIAEINNGKVNLYSRNGNTFNVAYPRIVEALKKIKINCVLDGEIVAFDENGKPSFQKMQNYKNNSGVPIQFFVFDCLRESNEDLTKLPLIARKMRLKKILPKTGIVLYCDHHAEKGVEFYNGIISMNLEGMIAKKSDSRYYPGKRSADWLKIKNRLTREFIIIGYTKPEGSREYFGSLLLGVYWGKKLKSAGNVGTGFTSKLLKDLYLKLSKEKRSKTPLDIPIKEEVGVTWVNPVFVCNIEYAEITDDGNVRQAAYLGLRKDKAPMEVTFGNDVEK